MTRDPMDRLRSANPIDDAEGDAWAAGEAGRRVRDAVRQEIPLALDVPAADTPTPSRRPLLVAAVLLVLLAVAGGVAVLGDRPEPEDRAETSPSTVPRPTTEPLQDDRTTTTALALHDPALCGRSAFPVLDPLSRPAPEASLQLAAGTVSLRFGDPDDPLHWFAVDTGWGPVVGDRPLRLTTPDGPVDARTSLEIVEDRPYMTISWIDAASGQKVVVSSLGFRVRSEVAQLASRVRLAPAPEFAAFLDEIGIANPCRDPATNGSDPSTPTANARSGVEAVLARPVDGDDCGSTAADSGWPTTTVAAPLNSGSCLLAARSTGRAAHQSFTGRTGDGGALVTRYLLEPSGEVEVQRWTIERDGAAQAATARCRPPDGMWSIGIDGQLVLVGTSTFSC